MNEQNEVRATGGMPGLELIVNSIKELRFKIVKLSTYNSLENQLKLKDTIISNQSKSLVEKTNENNNLQKDLNSLRKRFNTLFELNDSLEKQIVIQNEMISINEDSILEYKNNLRVNLETINNLTKKNTELQYKLSRKYQPRSGGKFAKKNK